MTELNKKNYPGMTWFRTGYRPRVGDRITFVALLMNCTAIDQFKHNFFINTLIPCKETDSSGVDNNNCPFIFNINYILINL